MPSRQTRSADDIDALVGQRLLAFRERAGLTRADVAKAIGVTFQQVEKYEKGTNRVAASRLYRLAHFFGCSIEAFFPAQDAGERDVGSPLNEMGGSKAGRRMADLFVQLPDRKREALLGVAEAMLEPSEDGAATEQD